MKFGYMIDNSAYEPHYLEETSIQRAVSLLEQKLLVMRMSQRDSVAPVEFWEDKGVERKDMTFEDVRGVYKLYPGRDGHLKCDDLAQRLWNELPAQQRAPHMEKWLGDHHTRGLVYLRYGEVGWCYGVDGLARFGAIVLNHLNEATRMMTLSEKVSLYNSLGLSHDDAVQMDLFMDHNPYFTVRTANEPIPPELSGRSAPGTERWFASIEDALDHIYDTFAGGAQGHPSHYNLYLNGEKCIFQFEQGELKAVRGLDLSAELNDPDTCFITQMALATVQECVSHITMHPGRLFTDHFFYPVTTPESPSLIDAAHPEAGLNLALVAKNCAKNGIYDAASALKAFNDLGDVPGKRLDICVFGRNMKPEQQINVLRQEGTELICGDMPDRFVLGRNNHDICDILSRAFDKTLPLEHWTIRFITKGDHYGAGDCLTYQENKPMVAFYDADYKNKGNFGPYGQFTGGSYYLETLQGKDGYSPSYDEYPRQLSLMADIPKWTVSAKDMNVIMDWLNAREPQLLKDRKPSLSEQMQSAKKRTEQQKDAPTPGQEKDR